MKNDFYVGKEVFYIDKWKIKKSTIKSIEENEMGIRYRLKDYWGKSKIYKTQKQAEKDLNIEFNKLKFHIEDIVIGKNKNVILGKIIEIIFDEDLQDYIYLVSSIDKFGWNTKNSFQSKELIKVKQSYIENYSDVQIYIEAIDDLEKQAKDYQQKINDIFLKLDEELKTSYGEYTSYFNWNNQKYEDRFYKKH